MARTANISISGSFDGLAISSQETISGVAAFSYDDSIPSATTDFEIPAAFVVAECNFFMVRAEVAMTLETNSPSAPAQTIALQAGKAYIFRRTDYVAFLLTTNVTNFYITNASGAAGRLQILAVTLPA